jgi:hypothetical protein
MKRLAVWLLSLTLAMQIAYVLHHTAFVDRRAPISAWHKVEVLNSPLRAGEALRTRIYRDKVRDDCPVASSRQAISEDGLAFDVPDAISPGGAAGKPYVPWDYPLPQNMPPGQYELRVTLVYQCPGFNWTTQQPAARFRVVADE